MKKQAFWRYTALLLMLGAFFSLTGCNTIIGFGQDVGNAVSHVL